MLFRSHGHGHNHLHVSLHHMPGNSQSGIRIAGNSVIFTYDVNFDEHEAYIEKIDLLNYYIKQ